MRSSPCSRSSRAHDAHPPLPGPALRRREGVALEGDRAALRRDRGRRSRGLLRARPAQRDPPRAHAPRRGRGAHRLRRRARHARGVDALGCAGARSAAGLLRAAPVVQRAGRQDARARRLLRPAPPRGLRAPQRAPPRAHARGPQGRPSEDAARDARESLDRVPALRGPRGGAAAAPRSGARSGAAGRGARRGRCDAPAGAHRGSRPHRVGAGVPRAAAAGDRRRPSPLRDGARLPRRAARRPARRRRRRAFRVDPRLLRQRLRARKPAAPDPPPDPARRPAERPGVGRAAAGLELRERRAAQRRGVAGAARVAARAAARTPRLRGGRCERAAARVLEAARDGRAPPASSRCA